MPESPILFAGSCALREEAKGSLTHCPYCGLQCPMELVTLPSGSQVFPGDPEWGLCRKGWTAAELLDRNDRLLTPWVRDHKRAKLRPASWGEALRKIAESLGKLRATYGLSAVGVFGGGSLTNEKAYLLGKFARVVLGTPHVDYNGRFCMSSAAAAITRSLGLDRGLPFPLEDIPQTEVILLAGANLAETMPPVMRYFQRQKERGGRWIVVDPRKTSLAEKADLHLAITPGTDAALAMGLVHLALREGWVDWEFVRERTEGLQELALVASQFWPERVESITGVPVFRLREAARWLGRAKTAMIFTARGAEQQAHGVENVLGYLNLALVLGKIGRPFCGFGTWTGQGNGQGARELGLKCDQLPGYRSIQDRKARQEIAALWGIPETALPREGLSAWELLDGIGTREGIRGLVVMGSNIAVSAPYSSRVIQALESLEFLLVVDFFLSETALLADVVLPAAQWAEEEGTMTNVEGRVVLRQKLKKPPPGVCTDLEILHQLARVLGWKEGFPSDPCEVWEEIRRATRGAPADYYGVTYERLRRGERLFWPCPQLGHPGKARLFLDRFETPTGKARFFPVRNFGPVEIPDSQYPLLLTTGRVGAHYQSGTQTRRTRELLEAEPEPFVEMHPATARSLGIPHGGWARIWTRRGEIRVRARWSRRILPHVLFVPFHWSGLGQANRLTNPALDPVSKMPEFKVCAAAVEPCSCPQEPESPDKQNCPEEGVTE
ncbi:molybdopterin oxidoreductase family protein [Candidatus Methylacidithermus pantelleriae]|uniref:Assimilatory nitrate reductase, catalytic subunit n=1 Tax=Candidatus Methylacidithermus pantelleriae TaxID=2744239 RepID=A0A8J2FMZ7_9BACT|nr:molybdopterin oxidoreductase family protein [Candidatus Methylacidithermus pantelleriae]CAF0691901.1 Assimilatory nitrate reductase, catalytic subunit [Candidatus Methylacidithermus pantelleriae]